MTDRHAKDECQNSDQDVKKSKHGASVASQIIPGKIHRLVGVTRNIIINTIVHIQHAKHGTKHRRSAAFSGSIHNGIHQIIRPFLLLDVICRITCIVSPCIVIRQTLFRESLKFLFCSHRHTEIDRIKHHIRIIFEHSRIVREGNKTGYRICLSVNRKFIARLCLIVVCKHSVDHDLIIILRKCTIHDTELVDLISALINTKLFFFLVLSLIGTLHIKIRIDRDIILFNLLDRLVLHCLLQVKMSVLHMIFLITFVTGCDHAVTCDHIAGLQTNGQHHKQKDHRIFSKFRTKFAEYSLI